MTGWLSAQLQRMRKMTALVASGRADELTYSLRNRLRKIDLEYVSVSDLGLSEDSSYWYSNSGGPELRRVFEQLDVPRGSVVVDFGCGKGGALFSMSAFPFAEMIGIDISADLISVARDNASRLGLRHVRFVLCDARSFTELDTVTHIYFYNPFPAAVMRHVMTNVSRSLARAPRDLTIVYKNPTCDEQIMATGVFRRIEEKKPGLHWWYIYRHVSGGARETTC